MKLLALFCVLLVALSLNPATKTDGAVRGAADQPANPGVRRGHCLIYDDERRQVLLVSGYQPPNQPQFDELWRWKGGGWEHLPGSGPVARSLSGAVYDTHRKRIVLFGGVGNKGYEELKGDTWEWDGASWRQMADTSVGTRDHHVMVYDAARQKTLLYGGLTSDRSWVKSTWLWDGVKWTKLDVPGPDGRVHFAMAYDSKRQRVVLFGGSGEDHHYHNDTWEWDGAAWQKVSSEGPPPRARHRMVYDSRAGVTLLYGGDREKGTSGDGFIGLDDMWMWDGKRWTEVKTSGPGRRFMHAMVYDSGRGKTVLYGGGIDHSLPDDTWEWDGKSWKRVN
jgi:hypothetical protein